MLGNQGNRESLASGSFDSSGLLDMAYVAGKPIPVTSTDAL